MAAWDLFERIKNGLKGRKPLPVEESPASRFVALFESHGIERNQIPRLFGHGLTMADVQDDQSLIKVLDHEMLVAAASLFAIRLEWLECASSEAYLTHDFYKQPERFLELLDELLASGERVKGVIFLGGSRRRTGEDEALLVLEEAIPNFGDGSFVRYHLCNNWSFDYGISRAYLIACVSAAWNRKAYIHGREVSGEFIKKFSEGEGLVGQALKDGWPGRHWHPEEMAIDADKFLEGLEAGYQQGLALEVLIQLKSQNDRFSLDHMRSGLRGASLEEKLQALGGKVT